MAGKKGTANTVVAPNGHTVQPKKAKTKTSAALVQPAGVGAKRHAHHEKQHLYPALRRAGMTRLLNIAGHPVNAADVYVVLPEIAERVLVSFLAPAASIASVEGTTRVSSKHVDYVLRQRSMYVVGSSGKKKPKSVAPVVV